MDDETAVDMEDIDLLKRAGLMAGPDVEPYINADPEFSTDEKIRLLAAPGLLSERQAEAYVYREIEGLGRRETAEAMGLSASTVDDYRSVASEKISGAELTQKAVGVLTDGE